jgi:hypothetical protein
MLLSIQTKFKFPPNPDLQNQMAIMWLANVSLKELCWFFLAMSKLVQTCESNQFLVAWSLFEKALQ